MAKQPLDFFVVGPNADCADVLCALSVLCGKSPFFRCYLCVHCVNDLPARSVSRHEFVRAETIPKPLSSRPRTKELATEEEWRDPEAVSSPMLIQGVSTRALSRNPVVIPLVSKVTLLPLWPLRPLREMV